jgi:uncharacterized membrane protein
MDGQTVVLILRFLHVVGGVFWVGAITVMAWFLFPVARGAGPEGFKFLQQVMEARRMGMWVGISAMATVLSGIILYARFASATDGAWTRTPSGIGFSVGAVTALVGLGVGLGLAVRSVNRIRAIATEAAAAGGPPTAAQAAEMQRLQARAGTAMRVTSLLLLAATAVMGTARYW